MDFDTGAAPARERVFVDIAGVSNDMVIDITDGAITAGRAGVRIPVPRWPADTATRIAAPPRVGRRVPAVDVLPIHPAAAFVNRTLDIVVSVVTLVVFAPLMLALVALIRLDSSGPAVFRHHRLSRGGGTFRFAKFRTMYVDARERFPELYSYSYTHDDIQSMKFKLPEDPRLTRVGRWLRRTSLDELPNLFNVLLGHMTLVGPRPEIPEMVHYYTPQQLKKFSVKPGLTGLAQTRGRNILTFQQTLSADLEYVATRSLTLDLRILVRTLWTVAVQFGAL